EFFYAYILFNRTYAEAGSLTYLIVNAVEQAYRNLASLPILLLALISLLLGLLFLRGTPPLCRVGVLLAFGALSVSVFCGRAMLYTQRPLLLAAFPGVIALVGALPRGWARGTGGALVSGALCLGLGAAAVVHNQMVFCKDFT